MQKRSLAECQSAFDTFMRLRATVRRKDDSDTQVPEKPLDLPAAQCFAKAGDCAVAFSVFSKLNAAKGPDDGFKAKDDKTLRTVFDGLIPACKGR